MRYLYSLLVLLSSVQLQAQNKVGNGGDVVSCSRSNQLLDFYESSMNLESKDKNHISILEKEFKKLEVASPRLAAQYLRRLKEIQSEIDFKKDVKLTDVKDSLHLFEPLTSDCKIYQIAIRRPSVAEGEKRFIIRKDLWDKLSPTHRAGLLSHEIIYEHFSRLGESDSRKVRKFNSYLFTKALDKEGFWKFVRDLEVPLYPQ